MEKKKALAAVMATMLIASSLTACGGTKDTENMDASQTSSAQTQAVSLDGDKTTTVKTVKMGDNDVEVEVTDIGKTGTFTFWSAYTGDSAIWEQKRVDAFNEAYADLGIKCDLQFVPDGAGINNGKLLSAIAGGTAPDLIVTDNSISCYQYAAEGSFMGLDAVLDEIDLDVSSFFEGCKDVMYYNDVCYLIPQDTNVIMLYYNPEIAKECGLDPENPPKTIEELDSWSDAMTVKAADGSYNRLGIVPWLDSGNEAFILPFAEKQHGDPKNQRAAEERKETPLQYAHGAAQLRVDRRLEPEQQPRRNHHAQIKNLFHSQLHCVLFPPAA